MYQQSTDQLWKCVASAVRAVLPEEDGDELVVRGVGFDATCSLVLVDEAGKAVRLVLQHDYVYIKYDLLGPSYRGHLPFRDFLMVTS